ncbi:hypothetical protein RPR_06240 [Rickettsia peacockii str. Rustic]|uniref:Uncharacterized protein n=3 Tax=spotted fever group TaxID=114277 RepID=C4K2I1_RICPU|nr:palindromic element RPE1 domain-containing protein [Rickettsia peacockii]ACR47778.1 hypothetical protein RPR_06240 [Rickettsia peacockii str. Rustic]AEV92536.1 hypothetical protein Rsl_1164 [Rickettsia slovaca 13-B]AFD20017.1 hypothetical protein MC3_05615 [Rickettsia slovaca str. D-CWPP]
MQNRSVYNGREDSSAGSTYKLPLEVQFGKMSKKTSCCLNIRFTE